MADTGVRLLLFVGPTVPLPAPFEVADALLDLQVTNNDRDRDGFQMRFSIGKESPLDYGLLLRGALDPPARVSVAVLFGARFEVLINGVITSHQVAPANRPGGRRPRCARRCPASRPSSAPPRLRAVPRRRWSRGPTP